MNDHTSSDTRGPIAWMAANKVAANLLMIVLLVGGLIWSTRIRQDVYPDFESDTVNISVAYPGASPEEVEQGIVLAVEEAVQGLDGVDEVSSAAREGIGTVNILALAGADIQALAQDVQNEIDRITSFPEEAEEPRVEISTRRRYVISLVVHGRLDERLLRLTAEDIRDGLLQEPGITQVDLAGTRGLEIAIEVPLAKLRAYGLTLTQVAQRVRDAAVEMGGGGLKTEAGEILVRMKERRDWGREFAQIPIITAPDGTQVRLEDLARIHDGLEDTDYFATFEGQPAVMVEVYRVGDQTPIAVAKAVRRYLERLRPNLPPGLAVEVRNDRSEIYRQRLELLVTNGAFGLLLVFLMLGLFLEARLAFWVAMGIPISFLGSLLFLPGAGVTINMMSMFAFIIALGIVVDDAIVVGENVYHFRQAGLSHLEAAVRGAREVAMPVTFSILTNIVAFLPLAFVPGWMGKVYFTIPVVVITVFLISLAESVFILPAHLAHLRERSPGGLGDWLHRHQQRFSYYFMGFVRERYGPFLAACLRQRYLTVALGLTLLLLVLGYVKSGRMGMVLFPRVESDFAFAKAQLPYGTAAARTEAVRDRLIQTAREIAAEYPGLKVMEGIYADVGPSHVTQVRVYLPPPDERPVPTAEFVRQWRQRTGELPGLEWLVFQSDSGGPGSGAALTVELTHPRLEVLERAGADLALRLADFTIVRDIDDGFAPGKQQLDFTVRPEGRALGLTAREVARQVRNSFYGAEALRQQRGRNEIKVMVRLPEAERQTEYTLEELILRAPNGAEVPLREAVDIQRGRAYTEIKRRAGRRVISVTADVDPPSQAEWVVKALKADALPDLVERYPGLRYGFEGRQAETADSMRSLYLGLMLALLAMYGLLAVPFRSYVQPAIIMVSIPFGIVGAVLGHMLMGYSLSVMSMFGIVALSGVVVNDSLVLIEFANRVRGQGMSPREAMLAAAVQRFRPVLLTTLTTFGGLAPMIFETSRQARFMIPMAISLGFGVLFATLITLLLVPALFLIVEDLRLMVHAAPRASELASAPSRPLVPPLPGPPTRRRAARRAHSSDTNL
jgi:multidrug efflux pump subunit AcrB